MTKTVDEIREIVDRIESRQSSWVSQADEMEKMWSLDLWDAESDDERIYVTQSVPYNAVATARRMVNTLEPNVECPGLDFDGESDKIQQSKERWLKAMWKQNTRDQRENVAGSVLWQSITLGKGTFQILWVKDALPSSMRNTRLPFIIRSLDPRLCGFEDGPLYLQYAYYKPTMSNVAISQQTPTYVYEDEEDAEQEVIEFWWIDPETGKVWNAIVVNDQFIVDPVQTKYYSIPIVEVPGLYQPSEDEVNRYHSLIFPIKNNWETTSDIMTMVTTSLLYHFLPPQPLVNADGHAMNDDPLVPGEFRQYPPGSSFPNIAAQPNVPLANYALQNLAQDVGESTFTGASSGAPLGSNQAGYSYNSAMAADESRITEFRNNLQVAMSTINEIALHMVKVMAGSKGITVFGRGVTEGGRYLIELLPEQVGNNFQNDVYLKPVLERDQAAKVAMMTRLVESGILSRQTARDMFIDQELPEDEQQRIELEKAMANPAAAPMVALETLNAYGLNTEAMRQIAAMLQAQVDATMAQLQQAQQPQGQPGQGGSPPGGLPGGPPGPPGPQQSVSQGTLSPQQEGIPSDSTFAAGNGERVSPQDVAQITGR